MRLDRRQFLKLSGLAIAGTSLSGGLAACGGSDPNTVVLSISPDLVDLMKGPLRRFDRAHPKKVAIRVMPADTGQYLDRIRTQLQAGTADIDVIAGDISWPSQFAANGWLADLSSRFTPQERAAYLPTAIAANIYEQKIYGVPFFTDTGMLWYRKDLLERSGFSEPPTTWAELQEMALKVKRDHGIKNGYVFQGADYEGGVLNGLEFIRTSGGDAVRGNDVLVGQPEAIRGLTIERSMVDKGVSPKAVANFKEDECTGAFLGGDAVFMRNWPYVFGLLSDKEQSDLDPGQVAVAELPVADAGARRLNVGGGWNFYINESSEKQDAAWELVEFLSAPRQQRLWAVEGSYLPTRTALYEDRRIVDALPAVQRGKEAILHTTTPPPSPYYSDLSRAMARQFNASLLGSSSPEQVAEDLQGELEDIIERAS